MILWIIFWDLSFVNSNTWHLICNSFNFNFIYGTACLYVCVCAFSLRRESPDMILGDKPLISKVVLSQLVLEQDWGKTHMKASKNYNNVFDEEHLAHIRTIVVSLGGMLTYVLIFRVFILFCCWWPYFVVCDLCRTIAACGCLLLLFMDIFGCLYLANRTWVSTSVLVLCGHEWVLRYWSFVDMCEKWWLMWSIFCRYTNSR
jgi:hypothetical protein